MARPVKYNRADTVRVYNTPMTNPQTASVYQRTMNPTQAQGASVMAPTPAAQTTNPQFTPPTPQTVNTLDVPTPQDNTLLPASERYTIPTYVTPKAPKPKNSDGPGFPSLDKKDRKNVGKTSVYTSKTGKAVVDTARKYIGQNRYVYGGWDCSKFVQTVAAKNGHNIPRSTGAQIPWFKAKNQWYSLKNAKAGDLIFMRSSGSASGRHVGIYIGNGMMIDNAGRGLPIKIRSIAGRSILGFGRLPQAKKVKTGGANGRLAGTNVLER